MNKRITVAMYSIMLVFICIACKNKPAKSLGQEGYKVSGKVIGIDQGYLTDGKDTIEIKQGAFTLEGQLDGATQRFYQLNDAYNFSLFLENDTFEVIVDPSTADERGAISTIEVIGSALNDEYKRVAAVLEKTPERKKLTELFEASLTIEKGTTAYEEHNEKLSDAREASRKVQAAYIKDYALNNPESVMAAYYMRFQANEVDQTFSEYEQIVEGFSENVKKSTFYPPLIAELDGLRKTAIGQTAPDFTLKTDQNEDFTLSSLRGEKIVLVDFWASWCVPCRKSYPHLKKTYARFKDMGFEIVGVTNDSNHDAWKRAISEDKLPWIQVVDVFPPRDGEPPYTAKVITSYAAPYLPSTYLLDKEGKIIAKHLHGDELDSALAELLEE